ncbi:sensor histidine kinase [Nonomuraea rhodomycinica]|uniref:histidine kinase n=1 Tax=Nonomuraea rhodomycinica TaxID=1712872 RepID=A0A7Y6IZI4_9ACTN|nr:HAMP domain-containing sensor histidine kinase [Nonomuraea rhodomycinica]NUW45909.1 HAMP domain-containing histidine kinase [Nonomuraea rhodomycinica]
MRAPVPRTLRGRLIAGLLVLLALACAAVGVATSVAMEHFLLERVDQQLVSAGGRFPASLERGEESRDRGDTRGQARGTLGVRLLNGTVTDAAVVASRYGAEPRLTAEDQAVLRAVPADGVPRTVDLGVLDDYRVLALPGADGDVLITGLPLHEAEETMHRLQLFEAVLFAAALAVTGVAGAVWVRLALRPLDRVTATARRVAELPLASGEVTLAERVPDTDPRTETGQVGAALNRMLGHVADALGRRHAVEQRLRAFAADASHELRTPLTAIRGHAELALRVTEPMPGSVRHALDRIDAESGRMGELVEDLLLLARLDAGRPLARGEVDLTRLAIEATGDARAAGPDHRWRLELPQEPVTVTGDAPRIHQVVANLLANARVHTPAGTTVTVSVRPLPDGAELTVADDGPGIPAELREEIFERFSRVDKDRSRASGGTGLGLAIVRAVVSAHGGTAGVDGGPGGTAFWIRLPAEPPPVEADTAPPS